MAGNQLFLRITWEAKSYMHTCTYTCTCMCIKLSVMCSADFPNSWKAWGKQFICMFSYNSNKNNRKSRILSVAASLELLYFVLAASALRWFVLAAGYQADVDASWLVFFGLILRVGQSTQLHANYYSGLTLLRDSLTWRDLRADPALSWRLDYQISEVPCNSNCMILWWYVIVILKFGFCHYSSVKQT